MHMHAQDMKPLVLFFYPKLPLDSIIVRVVVYGCSGGIEVLFNDNNTVYHMILKGFSNDSDCP